MTQNGFESEPDDDRLATSEGSQKSHLPSRKFLGNFLAPLLVQRALRWPEAQLCVLSFSCIIHLAAASLDLGAGDTLFMSCAEA